MNFSSIGVQCTRVYAETLRKPAQQLEHPANFFVYRTRHPNSIQLVLCVVEEVWRRVTSTKSVKEGKGIWQGRVPSPMFHRLN